MPVCGYAGMNIASRTRAAVRREPFVYDALAAGILNYTAAARYLDVDQEEEAVAAALRRYAEEIARPDGPTAPRVDMRRGLGPVDAADALLTVGDAAFGPTDGSLTAILVSGDVPVTALGSVLARLDVEKIAVEAAGGSRGHLVCLVEAGDGADALRAVEETLGS